MPISSHKYGLRGDRTGRQERQHIDTSPAQAVVFAGNRVIVSDCEVLVGAIYEGPLLGGELIALSGPRSKGGTRGQHTWAAHVT